MIGEGCGNHENYNNNGLEMRLMQLVAVDMKPTMLHKIQSKIQASQMQ